MHACVYISIYILKSIYTHTHAVSKYTHAAISTAVLRLLRNGCCSILCLQVPIVHRIVELEIYLQILLDVAGPM